MSKFLRLIVDYISYDANQSTNDPANALKIKNKVEFDEVDTVNAFVPLSIADATVDQSIALPGSNTDYLIIQTDQEISIKLNGSADSQTLKPKAAGVKTTVLVMKGDIDSLTVSNASGSTASMDIISVLI